VLQIPRLLSQKKQHSSVSLALVLQVLFQKQQLVHEASDTEADNWAKPTGRRLHHPRLHHRVVSALRVQKQRRSLANLPLNHSHQLQLQLDKQQQQARHLYVYALSQSSVPWAFPPRVYYA
jgi:hypothetical protein